MRCLSASTILKMFITQVYTLKVWGYPPCRYVGGHTPLPPFLQHVIIACTWEIHLQLVDGFLALCIGCNIQERVVVSAVLHMVIQSVSPGYRVADTREQ